MDEQNYEISEERVLQGIQICLTNIKVLLGKSQKVCEKNTDNSIALGLYTFTVEEYGKLIFLKEAQKKTHSISKNVFLGRNSHKLKFDKAIGHLPTECVQPVYGVEIHANCNLDTVSVSVTPSEDEIKVGAGLTGTFSITGDDYPMDLVTRMACFYLDWDDKRKMWRTRPKVLADGLEYAITKLGLIIKLITLELENNSKES